MRSAVLVLGIVLAGVAAAQETDYSKVQVKSAPLAGNVYLLLGAGGNITALTGPDGVLIVDAEFAPLADKIRAALKGLGAEKPVRFVIDTHYHVDHSEGNLPFAQGGAIVIAADSVRTHLANGATVGNGGSIKRDYPASDPGALPIITYDHTLSLHLDGEDIQAYHYPNAHTDGDTVVSFAHAKVIAMGDIYVRYGFPFIDNLNGGTVQGMIAACDAVLAAAPPDAIIVPGHGERATVSDLREFVQMLKDTSAAVARALKAGKTLAQMKEEKVLGAWSERYAPPGTFVDANAFTESLYNSLVRPHAPHGGLPHRPGT
jgi:cyclase